ncbi:MAG TPA: GNAT family N-acetyltransferase [Ignavibacteriaceae bacterium]|nr:GNAT family N-acetyltransferase [Ignavibacteriaceae bacterium]
MNRYLMQFNEELIIREAKKTDAAALAILSGELGYPTTMEEMESRFDKLFSKSDNCIYVAELNSIVGWIHVSLIQTLESNAFVEICGLVVTESLRGSGIGTQLVVTAENWAQEKGCYHIRVRTNILREKTKMFYKQVGFQSKKTQEVFNKTIKIDDLTSDSK